MSNAPEKPENNTPTEADTAGGREQSFLSRWSRRKQEARMQEADAVREDEEAAAPPAPAPEKVLTDADVPPIESLDENSDFSVFMSAGVSETLRRRALRKLFTLPEINKRCPLDGEWYDCHGFEPLGDVITHDMREEMERAARKLKESADALLENQESPAAAPAAAQMPAQASTDGGAAPDPAPASVRAEKVSRHKRGKKRHKPQESNA